MSPALRAWECWKICFRSCLQKWVMAFLTETADLGRPLQTGLGDLLSLCRSDWAGNGLREHLAPQEETPRTHRRPPLSRGQRGPRFPGGRGCARNRPSGDDRPPGLLYKRKSRKEAFGVHNYVSGLSSSEMVTAGNPISCNFLNEHFLKK